MKIILNLVTRQLCPMAMKFKENRLEERPNYQAARGAYMSSTGPVKNLPAVMLLHVASFIAYTRVSHSLHTSERAQCLRDA